MSAAEMGRVARRVERRVNQIRRRVDELELELEAIADELYWLHFDLIDVYDAPTWQEDQARRVAGSLNMAAEFLNGELGDPVSSIFDPTYRHPLGP
jgi:hypothetical protein